MRLKDTIKKARKYLAVLYTEEGVFEEYLFLPSNLNLIMMDTEIIAKSQVRLCVERVIPVNYIETEMARASHSIGKVDCPGLY